MPEPRRAARALADRLRRVAPGARILSHPAELAAYACDGLGHKRFPPDLVAIPADAPEAIALARELAAADVPFTPRGAGTSLCGGPVAAQGGAILHLSRLRAIRAIDTENRCAEVEAGVVLDQLDAALAPLGLYYPPDPSTGPVCTLGGNAASNAGGAHCFRYGVTANYILGLEAILPDGRVVRFGGPAGGRGPFRDDWKRLFVGSEGTLGIFTRLWLRLIPRPEKVWTFRATYRDLEQASEAVRRLANHPAYPSAIEFMDPRCVDMVESSPLRVGLPRGRYLLLAEIDGPAHLADARADAVAERMRQAGADGVSFACAPAERRELWKARKCLGGLLGHAAPNYAVQDAVIPKARLGEMLDYIYRTADSAGLPAVTLMHAGDGNIHPNFLFDDRNPDEVAKVETAGKALMKKVSELGGTLSGEHGIGNDKAEYTAAHFGPVGASMQMAVPATFNPRHQLNPLKVFPERRFRAAASSPPNIPEIAGDRPVEDGDRARLFAPFFDPADMIGLFPADASLAHVNDMAATGGLHFPLVLDPAATLAEHLASADHAPASARFGPFADNITGMNWRLPSGRRVRIGERVVKSATGYDLLRFLLHSDGRYGWAEAYVLRLRPLSPAVVRARFDGDAPALDAAVTRLGSGPWAHWIDRADQLFPPGGGSHIEVECGCLEGEESLFLAYFHAVARKTGCALARGSSSSSGLPALCLKTTVGRAARVAARCREGLSTGCRALLFNGVVLVDQPPKTHLADAGAGAARFDPEFLGELRAELEAEGGHLSGNLAPRGVPRPEELAWANSLEEAWGRL